MRKVEAGQAHVVITRRHRGGEVEDGKEGVDNRPADRASVASSLRAQAVSVMAVDRVYGHGRMHRRRRPRCPVDDGGLKTTTLASSWKLSQKRV
jgi:hypothetical protein